MGRLNWPCFFIISSGEMLRYFSFSGISSFPLRKPLPFPSRARHGRSVVSSQLGYLRRLTINRESNYEWPVEMRHQQAAQLWEAAARLSLLPPSPPSHTRTFPESTCYSTKLKRCVNFNFTYNCNCLVANDCIAFQILS